MRLTAVKQYNGTSAVNVVNLEGNQIIFRDRLCVTQAQRSVRHLPEHPLVSGNGIGETVVPAHR